MFRGNFAESFGEDFFGLKELGIADEFGLSSLTIPKRLLKGKKGGIKEDPSAYALSLSTSVVPLSENSFQCETYRTSATLPATSVIYTPRFKHNRQPDRLAQAVLPWPRCRDILCARCGARPPATVGRNATHRRSICPCLCTLDLNILPLLYACQRCLCRPFRRPRSDRPARSYPGCHHPRRPTKSLTYQDRASWYHQ